MRGLATTDVAFTADVPARAAGAAAVDRTADARPRDRSAGLALGLAAATKFSALVLPVFALLAVVARRSLGPRPGTGRRLLGQAPLAGARARSLVVWGVVSFRGRRAGRRCGSRPGCDDTRARLSSRRSGRRHAAAWLLAHRLPAPRAFLAALGLCGQEAPGRSTSYLLGQLTPGRLPGVLPDRARREDAAAGRRAGGVRIRRARASTAGDAEARFRALAPVLAIAVLPGDGHPVAPPTSACATCCRCCR